jgi:hypothetical protein
MFEGIKFNSQFLILPVIGYLFQRGTKMLLYIFRTFASGKIEIEKITN